MEVAGAGLLAGEEGGSHLHGLRPEREGGNHAAGVADPASGDHRNIDGVDDLGHERQRARERILGTP